MNRKNGVMDYDFKGSRWVRIEKDNLFFIREILKMFVWGVYDGNGFWEDEYF